MMCRRADPLMTAEAPEAYHSGASYLLFKHYWGKNMFDTRISTCALATAGVLFIGSQGKRSTARM